MAVKHTLTRIMPDSRVVYVDENLNILFDEIVGLSGETIFKYNKKEGNIIVQIYIHNLNYVYLHIRDFLLPTKNSLMQVNQVYDRVYSNP